MNQSSSSIQTNNIDQNTRFNCPNCWGFQQWNDQYQATNITLDQSPKASSSRDGFIRKFMLKYVIGAK